MKRNEFFCEALLSVLSRRRPVTQSNTLLFIVTYRACVTIKCCKLLYNYIGNYIGKTSNCVGNSQRGGGLDKATRAMSQI